MHFQRSEDLYKTGWKDGIPGEEREDMK